MTEHSRIDLSSFLSILRQRWVPILACVILAGAAALAFSLAQPKSYKASADLLFQKDDLDSSVFGSTGTDSQTAPERVAATNLELASLQVVAESVKQRLDTPLSVEKLQDRIAIEPKGQADIVTVTAKGPTRREAVLIANTFADAVEASRRRAAQEKVQRAIDALELSQRDAPATQPSNGTGVTPAARLEQLRAIKALQQGDVTVVQRAVPPLDPAAPKPVRNTIVGVLLGLIIGVFVALLLQRLDRRVRDDEELITVAGAPVLSRVPVSARGRREDSFEALQFLRANLQLQDPGREARVIAVTSPLAGDGKTTIAAGLAEALALSGEKVVAIDCDLRDPKLHEHLNVERGPGVTEALVELRSAERLLVEASPGLSVLSAGVMVIDPFLIVSALMRLPELLIGLRDVADYVILDTPPVSVAADASTVASIADGVILVVDGTRVRRDILTASRDQLEHARARLLGIVVNRASAPLFGAEYGGYRAPREEIRVP